MSYDSVEVSVNSGKPIELFDFQLGLDHYRYTSGSEIITYNIYDYVPELIHREDIELTDDSFKNELTVKINRDNTFFRKYIQAPVEGIVSLTIYRGHGSNFITFWTGLVSQVTFNSEDISILLLPKTSGLARTGVRRKYQKLCNYALYEVGCGVSDTSYRTTGVIATIDRFTITSAIFATKADGWFTAGRFVVGDAERLITSHTGSTITLDRRMLDAVAGNSFEAFAGCDHSQDTCRSKFDNLINYGGQPWIPTKNPFSGDAIA